MPKYIIRLDDACSTMNHVNWNRIEELLDKYNIRPIVGIIPENRDKEFCWETDETFWDKALLWQEKKWAIAQHGLHHEMKKHKSGRGYYQLSHSVNTEFAGVPLEKQIIMLEDGNRILRDKGIYPSCFFAPAHTYDLNTVKAIKKVPGIKYISDGYALRPYKKDGMFFLPSVCDGPFKMPFGIFTFVFHPSFMNEKDFIRLEKFLERNYKNVFSAHEVNWDEAKNQGCIGRILEYLIFILRAIRKKIRLYNKWGG